jgi:FkbM family methyltransferase
VKTPYGVRLHAHWSDATFRYISKGMYGFDYSSYLGRISNPFVFLDIGANQGLYSFVAVNNPRCLHAHAFEPVSRTFSWLQNNLSLNPFSDRLSLHNLAVGDVDQDFEIAVNDGHSGVATLRELDACAEGTSRTELIRCISVNSMADLIDVPSEISLIIKIDVEGFEPRVIGALLNSDLERLIASIYFEVDERWWDPSAIFDLLEKKGFSRSFSNLGAEPCHFDVLYVRDPCSCGS